MANEQAGDGVKLLDPSDDIKPRVTKDVVPELVERLYGLKVLIPPLPVNASLSTIYSKTSIARTLLEP